MAPRRRRIVSDTLDDDPTVVHTIGKRKAITTVAAEYEESMKKRREMLQSLPSAAQAIASAVAVAGGAEPDDDTPSMPLDLLMDYIPDSEDEIEPPDLSHEGGEVDDAANAVYIHIIGGKQSKIHSTTGRRDRLRAMERNWADQIPQLAEAYLRWKHSLGVVSTPSSLHRFQVTAIYTHTYERVSEIEQWADEAANVSLIRVGLLGCSPLHPTVAISLNTLELLHRLRRRHPQLGIQAMTRALCDIHGVMYASWLRDQMSDAFDIYLRILRYIKHGVDSLLGRDDPNWRMKNSCPCCNYKAEGETPLFPTRLIAIDGNNSTKRVASAASADERVFHSSYFLSREEVDRFKDEVKRKPPAESDSEPDAPWISEETSGDAADGDDNPTPCAKTWKASAAEHEKRALNIYETTGMFVSACRHGFIQIACEMVRSGELAKYPLAIVHHLCKVHGHGIGCGYDIGCSFNETVKNSKLVGPIAHETGIQFVVCAFHGYAHNRLCQLSFHPLYRDGYGIEDLEGMERVFSASNSVARGIRFASRYHWTQSLDLHFIQWDTDKYLELGRFLYNNYRQCIQIICEYIPDVRKLQDELNVSNADMEGWLEAERNFLRNLKEEPDDRVVECMYVQALINMQKADDKMNTIRGVFHNTPSSVSVNYTEITQETARLEADRWNALNNLTVAMREVSDLEAKLGLTVSWSPRDSKYQETLRYLRKRDFHRALDRLQGLVVQRLFELSKANMSGTGYKLRRSIWKALKTRGKAIRNALKTYNALAVKMAPPAPTLSWKEVVNYGFVSEFELLRHSYAHGDVSTSHWVVPAHREVLSKYFKIKAACSELGRLDIEAARLKASILAEETELTEACSRLTATNPLMGAELHCSLQARKRVNDMHTSLLQRIDRLRPLIQRAADSGSVMAPLNTSATISELEDDTQAGGADGGLDEIVQEEMTRMTDYFEELGLERNTEMRGGIPVHMLHNWKI